jgi:hypothetical protein
MSRRRRPAIDDDIYLTVTVAVPDCPGKVDATVVRSGQAGHRPAFDRRHRVAPLQGVLIGFTPLRPPSQP